MRRRGAEAPLGGQVNPAPLQGVDQEEYGAGASTPPSGGQGKQRDDGAPKPVRAMLLDAIAFGRSAMHGSATRGGIAGSFFALPPLTQARHRGIVQGHFGIEALDLPGFAAEAETKLGFFAGDEDGIKTADLLKRGDAAEEISATRMGFADGRIPFEIAHLVVRGGFGEALAPAAADDGEIGAIDKSRGGDIPPLSNEFAIAIDKLDEIKVGAVLNKARHAGIAGAGSGEGNGGIEFDDIHAHGSGHGDAAIGGARVDVDRFGYMRSG